MTYPQAPWTLKGYAIQTLHLVDVARVRPLIPSEFNIVSVWPGKTLSRVYVASYGTGSVLEYNELIVVAGLVNYSSKFGVWVSHIYVDHPNSLAGGREIWGLPKELAEFKWEKGDRSSVIVTQGNRQLCSLSYSRQSLKWRLPLSDTAFSALGNDLLMFKGEVESDLGLVSGNLEVPAESPFASLGLGQPWLTVYCDHLHFVGGAPERVGHRASVFSD
jgi:hypothetical protein